jgi:hypothetical protein
MLASKVLILDIGRRPYSVVIANKIRYSFNFSPFPHEYPLSALFPVPVTASYRQSINGWILGFCRHDDSMVDAF